MTAIKMRKNEIKKASKEIIAEIKKAHREGKRCMNFGSKSAAPELSIELLRRGYKIWWNKGTISVSW